MRALAGKLDDLRDLGVTAIELMPLADFTGQRNWGYDGVLPYAPDAAYGRPDDLKRWSTRAHGARADGVPRRRLQPFRAGRELPARLRADLLHRAPPDALGRRRSTSTASAAGAPVLRPQRALLARGVPFRRPALRRRARDPRRFAAPHPRRDRRERARPAGPRHPPDARERRQPGALAQRGRGASYTRAVERRLAPRLARAAHRRDRRLLRRLRRRAGASTSRAASPRASPTRARSPPFSKRAARRALAPPAALGLRRLPAEPRPGRQPRVRRAPHRSSPTGGSSTSPAPACCSRRRSRCCSWARNGRPRRRSCSSSISPPTRTSTRRCARAGGASSRASRRSPTTPR